MSEPEIVLEERSIIGSQELYDSLVHSIEWDERMRARKTASFGSAYNYSGITYPATPMQNSLVPLVDYIEARLGFRPNNCLVNYYPNGDSTMGFHSDSTEELADGTGVAIISLGSERSITFQSIEDKTLAHAYSLPCGSLLYMSAAVQFLWKHAILKQSNAGGRISLTFRKIL